MYYVLLSSVVLSGTVSSTVSGKVGVYLLNSIISAVRSASMLSTLATL